METERIKQITDFANEFNKRLKLSDEKLKQELKYKKINNSNKNTRNKDLILRKFNSCSHMKPKIAFEKDIFKPPLPWIPNNIKGNYFNKFEKLNDAHNITIWEKVIFRI